MLNKYVEHKLKIKVNTHLSLAGLDTNIDISSLVEKVKELGDYRITWEQNVPIDIEMYLSSNKVKVQSGKYFIFSEDGTFKHQLYSSEFIEFTLKEMREYKLNKILKEL
jgi:hypothetical protein